MLVGDLTSDLMTLAELKFNLEKWCHSEFDVGWNHVKRAIIHVSLPKGFIVYVCG